VPLNTRKGITDMKITMKQAEVAQYLRQQLLKTNPNIRFSFSQKETIRLNEGVVRVMEEEMINALKELKSRPKLSRKDRAALYS
jgi:hypothetical protein